MPNAEKWRATMLDKFDGTPEEKEKKLREYLGRIAIKGGNTGEKRGYFKNNPEAAREAQRKSAEAKRNKRSKTN